MNTMKNKVISEEAYNILISKKPSERKNFLSNAITFYERYLNNTTEVIYEMIRDGEITIDLDNIDSKERQEEINWYINNLR